MKFNRGTPSSMGGPDLGDITKRRKGPLSQGFTNLVHGSAASPSLSPQLSRSVIIPTLTALLINLLHSLDKAFKWTY